MAIQDLTAFLRDAIVWRWDAVSQRVAARACPSAPEWSRLVMDRETSRLVSGIPYREMQAIEISGRKWAEFGFKSYESVEFSEYDVCEAPRAIGRYDLVIMEQVLEHVLWPYRAVRNVFEMLRPSGFFLVTTPFLVKIHHAPHDCTRWTELGLKHLMAEGGFGLAEIRTGSWGNRTYVRRGLRSTPKGVCYRSWWHTVRNEPNYPVVVWALARKPAGGCSS